MTGTLGSGGGNPFQQAPSPVSNPMGDFWGNTGDPSNPAVTAAQPAASAQSQAAAAPPPPPPPTPTPTTSSLHDDISNILFGGGGQHATEPVKYQASAGQGMPDISAPLTAQAPTPPAASAPPGSAVANTMTGLPPEASGGIGAPRNISPSATVSPQSAPVSGNTGDVSSPDAAAAGATGAATPSIPKTIGKAATTLAQNLRSGAGSPETSPAPDIAGSAREAGAGPGGVGAGSTASPLQSPGGEAPSALQDLFSGNFGRFFADLLGQQGLPPSQNLAGTPAPGRGVGTVPPEAAGVSPPGLPTSAPSAAGGFSGGQSPMPPAPTQTASAAAPGAGAIGDPMGYQGGMGGRPGQIDPRYGTATAALPPTSAPGPLNQPPGGQPTPDGGRAPTNGMPGGLTPNAPPPLPGLGAIPNQANRPRHYEGTLTMPDGTQYRYGTGGGQFPSAPYGTFQVHPGAVGRIGKRIGAWAGYSDSNNPGNNTVHDPLYKGAGGTSARDGVEIHPDVSGRRLITNGCIGIDRGQANAFGRSFKNAAAKGPLMMTIKPDGSATMFYANTPPATAGQQPGGAAGIPSNENIDPRYGRHGVVHG